MTEFTASPHHSTDTSRLASLDAYRGLVMICLAANGFGLKQLSMNYPDSSTIKAIGLQFEHVAWVGCAFWDLIQPSFMFLVGVALPFSCARRQGAGATTSSLFRQSLVRSLTLILLGLFLASNGQKTTNFTFTNVLAQIGLGYSFLYLVRNRHFAIQTLIATAVLGGYWAWFAVTPAVKIENRKDYQLPEDWVLLEGFEAHWQKDANPAASFDRWFLNLFPPRQLPDELPQPSPTVPRDAADRDSANNESGSKEQSSTYFDQLAGCLRRLITRPEPYVFNAGGYQTLNFIPSFVTMLFGMMAGEFIRCDKYSWRKKFLGLVFSGLLLWGAGWCWSACGGCPLVKRIWTPSWTLYSSGYTLLALAGFYGVIDGLGWKRWAFPLVVAGMNSMVLYLSGQLLRGWTADLLRRHINEDLFNLFGPGCAPVVEATLVAFCFWLFVYWLYQQRIFLRI